ncbi:MAG TPA: DUF6428 family protein [Candidatus Limnocylindria bacterium]|jgi:hypothetical protein|nr:DUF6428 family protein [Candidatus Limnocylindria bacterium]
MKLSDLKTQLARHPEHTLRFVLPDATKVAAHAHVTEVARIEKHFIDCGGTLRADEFCRLQLWVADDLEHRLTAGKLLGVLEKASRSGVLKGDDLDVDVEHDLQFITQFPLASVEPLPEELLLHLTTRHTDCLAKDRCLPPLSSPQAISFKSFVRKP